MAAFMASAYAKCTGGLGVCIATSGPGASHLLTGLYDARLDHQPILTIVGNRCPTRSATTTKGDAIRKGLLKGAARQALSAILPSGKS